MKKYLPLLKKIALFSLIGFFALSILSVVLYSFVNPPITPLMLIRKAEYKKTGKPLPIKKKWVKLEDISPNMINAVIAAEDKNFPTHFGIDWEAVREARKEIKSGKRKRGGSTITQQTAKNVFLVPNRSYFRKGLELYFTLLIEVFWSKDRIMEVYLNVIELGKGVYGVEAASVRYFKKSSSKLTKSQAALVTSALPAPQRRKLAKPSAYMYKYQNRILEIMQERERLGLKYK
jgi:monofunctional biosynthetic peptidoglycan transglycosylase